MATRHVLYLTNAGLKGLVVQGAGVASRRSFPATTAGLLEFADYARGLRAVPTHVIVDLAEEEFRLDTIPHLGARDRETVLARKLGQLFRSSPYRHAILQGREPDGRRDDRVVYTAITNADALRPWIDILERLAVPLEGIHSAAIFSGRLLVDLRLATPHALLVTLTQGDAVRQTYFRDGEIRFSRLTPIDLEPGETLGGLLAGETARTWQYLDSLRYFGAEDRLDVCVIIHARDRAAIERDLRNYERVRYRMLDIGQVAARLGVRPAPATSNAEEILACLFARRGGENHFASPELRRFAVRRRAKIAILATAGATLAAGAIFGSWNLAAALEADEAQRQTLQRVASLEHQRAEIVRAMPMQAVGGETMRDAVAFYARSLRAYPTIGAFLLPISEVIARFPQVRLTQVAWQTADDENALPTYLPTVPRDAPALRAVVQGAGKAAPQPGGTEAAEGTFVAGRHSVAILEGTIAVSGVGFRDAIAQLEALAGEIGKIPGYRAAIVDSPLDVAPNAAIQGRFGDRPPAPSKARFSLRVARTVEPRA